jgi:hypothetical protein
LFRAGATLMARARNIKPGFFTDAELIECDHWVRLLFAGLWTLADREGRLLDKPKQIGVDLFPREALDISAGLDVLAAHGLIVRYTVDGQQLIQVKNFTTHQNPHKDERASTLPCLSLREEHGASTVQAPEEHGANPADSGFPVTDSLIADSSTHDAPAARVSAIDTQFQESFWSRWPKGRGSRKLALERWRGMTPEQRTLCLTRLPAFLACHDWQKEGGRYVKHAERWLKYEGWNDDIPPEPLARAPNGKPTAADVFLEAGRRVQERHDERRRNEQGAGDDKYALLAGSEGRGQERRPHGRDVDEGARGHPIDAVYRERP